MLSDPLILPTWINLKVTICSKQMTKKKFMTGLKTVMKLCMYNRIPTIWNTFRKTTTKKTKRKYTKIGLLWAKHWVLFPPHTPKFIVKSSILMVFWRQGFWEASTFRWDQEGGVSVLIRRGWDIRALCLSPPREDTVWRWPLKAKKRHLIRPGHTDTSILAFLPLELWEINVCCLSHSTYGI